MSATCWTPHPPISPRIRWVLLGLQSLLICAGYICWCWEPHDPALLLATRY
jgi:hypothetical protein